MSVSKTLKKSPLHSGLLGVCVGDALGLPVQFEPRSTRERSPIKDMIGYGVFNAPPGSWSDDSSLTLCLVDALTKADLNNRLQLLNLISKNFCHWYTEGFLTPFNQAYDIGGATTKAITKLLVGGSPLNSGGTTEQSNGNGSLMRILPLAFCHSLMTFSELIQVTDQVSAITHAHPRAMIACGIYISIAVQLLKGSDLKKSYLQGIEIIARMYQGEGYIQQWSNYNRIMGGKIHHLNINEIKSTGYVVHTLEASLWCLLNSNSYSEAVLKAVNLGDDTDTTAAVTGGLAGIYYGVDGIPEHWLTQLIKLEEIVKLLDSFENKLNQKQAR